jgi:hypothetical protein
MGTVALSNIDNVDVTMSIGSGVPDGITGRNLTGW